jgi:hypothetical protein
MSAITVVNAVPASIAPSAEFRVYQGPHQVARVGVHAGAQASVPTIADEHDEPVVNTAQPWSVYAIVNGITTPTVITSRPNATVTLRADNDDDGFSLTVS